MAEKFDPYHLWLGIPKGEQPAHHYRLLAIARFESDPQIIENAADQRMAFVRTFQSGKNAKECHRLLNELSAARVCLLDEKTRAAYDKQLRARPGKKKKPGKKTAPTAKTSPPKELKIRKKSTAQKPSSASGKTSRATPSISVSSRPTRQTARRGRKKSSSSTAVWAIAIAAILLVGLGIAFLTRGSNDDADVASQGKRPSATGQSSTRRLKKTGKGPRDKRSPRSQQPEDGQPTFDDFPQTPVKPPEGEGNPPLKNPFQNPVERPPESNPEDPINGPFEPEPPVARQPVPEAAAIEVALKEIQQIFQFAEAKTPEQKIELADKLLKASDTSDDAVERYVMIDRARDMAQQASDFRLALDAIGSLGEQFEVDDLALSEAVVSAMRIPTKLRDENLALAQASGELMWQAADQERFDLAIKFGETATSIARRIDDIEMAKEIVVGLNEIRQQQLAHLKLTRALAKLEDTPDDPESNFEAGRYYCLVREDWETGLPYMSRCQKDPWTALAQEELEDESDSSARLALGDQWWDLAQKLKDSEQTSLLRHAAAWYDQVLPKLDQLERARIEKRLATVDEQAPDRRPLRSKGPTPLVHWRFDEGQGTEAKDSRGKFHSRIVGAQWTEGVSGSALRFEDATDYVAIPEIGSTDTFTLAMWIHPESLRSKYPSLYHNDGWKEGALHVHLQQTGNFTFAINGISADQELGVQWSRSLIRMGIWQHVAVTYDKNAAKAAQYINGKLDVTHTLTKVTTCQIGPGRIAGWDGTPGPRFFHGAIDEVRLYGRVLSPEEVAALMLEGRKKRRGR